MRLDDYYNDDGDQYLPNLPQLYHWLTRSTLKTLNFFIISDDYLPFKKQLLLNDSCFFLIEHRRLKNRYDRMMMKMREREMLNDQMQSDEEEEEKDKDLSFNDNDDWTSELMNHQLLLLDEEMFEKSKKDFQNHSSIKQKQLYYF